MRGMVVLTVFVGLIVAAATSAAQSDYAARSHAIQFDTGFGITSGRDTDAMAEWLDSKIEIGSSATLRFGASGKFQIAGRFYLQPVLQMSFYGMTIDLKGKPVLNYQGQVLSWRELKWSNTHINFGVIPTYYLPLAQSNFRACGGLALKLHNNGMGTPELMYDGGKEDIDDLKESKFSFGLGPMIGGEFFTGERTSIQFNLEYDLIFSDRVSNVFLIQTGYAYYF